MKMMIIDENKLKRQNLGVDRLEANSYIGVLEWATGVGKTFAAILAINRIRILEQNRHLVIHVVVPSENLQTQWYKVLRENSINATVYVVNTYIKNNHLCDILILDEIHRFSNEEAVYFSQVIELTTYKYLIGLSATLDEKKKEFLAQYKIPVVDTITLGEAKRNGWVSDFIQYNLPLSLTEEEKKDYITYTNMIKYHFPYFNNDLKLALSCLNKQKRQAYCAMSGLDEKDVGMRAVRFNLAMTKRKSIMYEGKAKIDIIKFLVKEKYKTIIFSESTKYADLVEQTIPNAVAYHSKLPTRIINGKKYGAKKLKDRAIAMIESGIARIIITARSMDVGTDIDGINFLIIASGTQIELQNTQRTGRGVRFEENKKTIIVNLYFKDTVDQTWLEKRQKNGIAINWINNINEIDYDSE